MPVEDTGSSWAAPAAPAAAQKGFGGASRLTNKPVYTGPGPGSYSPRGTTRCTGLQPSSTAARTNTGTNRCNYPHTSSQGSTAAPGPGAHDPPRVAYTGADLAWSSHIKPGAAAAFKTPPRCSSRSSSAAHLREQLQQQRYLKGGQDSIPWLLSPPKHSGGRPMPGPQKGRLVQSALPLSRNKEGVHHQQQQRHGFAAAAYVGSSARGQLSQPVAPRAVLLHRTAQTANSHSSGGGRSSWQLQPGSAAAPGPGSYNLLQYGALKTQTHRSAFTLPLVRDRFGASALQQRVTQQQQQQQRQRQQQPQQQAGAHSRLGCRGAQAAAGSSSTNSNSNSTNTSSAMQKAAGRPHNTDQVVRVTSSRQPGVSAGFRSRSPGHDEAFLAAADAAMVGAPGPSYYSPQPPAHKVSCRQAREGVRGTFVAAV